MIIFYKPIFLRLYILIVTQKNVHKEINILSDILIK